VLGRIFGSMKEEEKLSKLDKEEFKNLFTFPF
jgi:hypothetical protein